MEEYNDETFRSTNQLFSLYTKCPYVVANQNEELKTTSTTVENQTKDYYDYLGPNLFVFGAQKSGKTHCIKQLVLNNTIKGKQVIVFCGEKWSLKEQRQFEQQLDKIGKSLVLIHIKNKKDFKY